MITMTELAKLAGVSQPTVSRVLNGNTSVNPEAARRVLEYAKKYNYQPNMIAKSLNGSKTCLLAVIVPSISNPFFADVIQAIEKEAEKAGYSILIFNSDYSQEKERKYLALLQQYRADGLLLAPAHANEESIRPFRQLTVPWMIITNRVENVDSVYVSHEKAGYMVAEHIHSAGVGKYIFVGKHTDRKFLGFEQGLRERGVDTRRHLTVFWEQDKEKMLELLVEYLHEIPERAGIFASNDMDALLVMNILMRAGISIPGKAALTGFDNTFISSQVQPGITSVRQPIDEMCSFAVKHLLEQIEGGPADVPCYTELTADLVVRGSTRS